MSVYDRHGAKPFMPARGKPGSAPRRESRYARQEGVRLLERIVVHQNRGVVSRKRVESGSRFGHSRRAPSDPIGVRRRIEQQFIGAHDPIRRRPLDHVADGDLVRAKAIVVKDEKRGDNNRRVAPRPNWVGILRRQNPKSARKSDQRLIARFPARRWRRGRGAVLHPQLMIAGRPDQSSETATQELECVRQVGLQIPTSPARISQSSGRRSIDLKSSSVGLMSEMKVANRPQVHAIAREFKA